MSVFGFAVDLGTTTIECCLVCMKDKTILERQNFPNPQSLYGSDIMNRIVATIRNPQLLQVMKQAVASKLLSCFDNMIKKTGISAYEVHEICICGNTTMVSILLEHDISSLGVYPFDAILKQGVMCETTQIFGECGYTCPVYLSGCASAFIGGDILAGLYFLRKDDKDAFCNKTCLFLDLGTNGEMVLYDNGKYYGASTACGPAFESCTRRQNVYGTTTIDAICLGLLSHKIGEDGRLVSGNTSSVHIQGVTLTADILHQVLLAKAAICAGIFTLCDAAQIEAKQIETVYLAGGFGFYLNLDSAFSIGLLPSCMESKIKILGNTSVLGAISLLGLEDKNLVMHDLLIHILNFAELPAYQDLFISNMYFRRVS
ncbi:MAG: ASKHA domain-containing protein [Eubacteriales bacterium]|nr:ASKHA domain-containing protein [Eubacteriales bacterium]